MGSNVLLTGKYVGDRTLVKELFVDKSGELISITHEHAKVHEGAFFSIGHYDGAVVKDSYIDILLHTSADYSVHTYIKLIAGSEATLTVYEDTVTSADGTAITAVNHNRNNGVASPNILAYHTPTITDVGTQIWFEYVPGGDAKSPGALQVAGTEQTVLAPDTKYLFRFTNISTSDSKLQLQTAFYEVPYP